MENPEQRYKIIKIKGENGGLNISEITRGLEEHFSYKVMGPLPWSNIEPFFDILKGTGYHVRTHSVYNGSNGSDVTLYVDRNPMAEREID